MQNPRSNTAVRLGASAILIVLLTLSARPCLAGTDTLPDTAAITSPQQALDAAVPFVGLKVGKETKPIASLAQAVQKVAMPDSTVPFYSHHDTTIDAWEVHLELALDEPQNFCSRLLSCVVRMNAITGAFLEARLPAEDSAASIPLQPGQYWQRHLESAMFKFQGFLNVPPPASLFQVLMNTPMLGHPCLGTEVVVWGVMLSSHDGPPKPYWCIVGRNSRFVEGHREKGQPSRDGMLVNYFSLIDATTGEPCVFMN